MGERGRQELIAACQIGDQEDFPEVPEGIRRVHLRGDCMPFELTQGKLCDKKQTFFSSSLLVGPQVRKLRDGKDGRSGFPEGKVRLRRGEPRDGALAFA